MSSLKHKKYEEIYGVAEAQVQRAIRVVQGKSGISLRPQLSFAGWRHSEQAKQQMSRTKQRKKYFRQLNQMIQFIKQMKNLPPEIHEIGLRFCNMLQEQRFNDKT